MVAVLDPASIWVQLANLCFLGSGLFWDLLVIRACLFLAYTWMLVAACVGYPIWPSTDNPGFISVDGIVWACLNLFFHGLAFTSLLWDERRVTFKDPEAQSMWLFFYRRSGMGKTEFLETYKRCRLRRFKAGELVLTAKQARRTLALVIEGLATYEVEVPAALRDGGEVPSSTSKGLLYSGTCFDKGLLNVFGIFVAFIKDVVHHTCTVTADTDCLVALWDLEDLNYLATGAGPAASNFWRNFTLCQLGMEFRFKERPEILLSSRSGVEPAGVLQGTARSSDFTDPLDELEAPPRLTLKSFLLWLPSKFGPFVPPGIRHLGLPVTGAMACRRITAVLNATGHEGVSDEEMLRLMGTPPRTFWRQLQLSVANLASEYSGSGRGKAKKDDSV